MTSLTPSVNFAELSGDDMTAMKAGATLRGGLWALQQQALYGKP